MQNYNSKTHIQRERDYFECIFSVVRIRSTRYIPTHLSGHTMCNKVCRCNKMCHGDRFSDKVHSAGATVCHHGRPTLSHKTKCAGASKCAVTPGDPSHTVSHSHTTPLVPWDSQVMKFPPPLEVGLLDPFLIEAIMNMNFTSIHIYWYSGK
jgi:hypothetical protein